MQISVAGSPNSLSGLERGMRWSPTEMDARRSAQPMAGPLSSAATPQTPRLASTRRAGGEFGASRRCASSLGSRPSFVDAPSAASECTPVAPTFQARQAASRRSAGFTLLELLVVVAIVAMASVGVGFAMRDSSLVQLDRDAQRLSALLEAARARSRVSGVPVRWHASAEGFRFEGLATSDLPQQWLDADTSVAGADGASDTVTLLLGPEPIIGPQELVLVSRSHPGKSVRLATDGVRPFTVQAAPP